MSRPWGQRIVCAIVGLCFVASFWAASSTSAQARAAQDLEDSADRGGVARRSTSAQARAAQDPLTWAGVDLVRQIPATASTPAVIHLRIASNNADASLRARLYGPVTTRSELLASLSLESVDGPPPTPLVADWTIEDSRTVAEDDHSVVVSVPIQLPSESVAADPFSVSDGRPLPLHLELASADGAVVGRLATFLLPPSDNPGVGTAETLTVAIVVDLQPPPAHRADGGAYLEPIALDRLLGLAQVLIERDDVPLTIEISGETLDALALIGDESSVTMLQAALVGKQVLASPWTSLDIDRWTRAGRADVVLDGLHRSAESLRWIGVEASAVMRFEGPPTAGAVTTVTDPATGVGAFVGTFTAQADPLLGAMLPPWPVALVADASGDSHPMVQADPLLEAMMRIGDTELGAQWTLAELARIAAKGIPSAIVVPVSVFQPMLDWEMFAYEQDRFFFLASATAPDALATLLDGLAANASLRPATVDDVLAESAPFGDVVVALEARPSDPGDFGLYLARRTRVEQRLHAYESLVGDGGSLAAPLRTLLAVSASQYLTTGERRELLAAVDRQASQGAAGVTLVERGRITIADRSADLPITLVNSRSAPVTVALELASDEVDFPQGSRTVFTLEPGRNDLSVPIEAKVSGRASVSVAVTTPDDAGAITLSTGTLRLRYTAAQGLGSLIAIFAVAALAAWWLRTRQRRGRATDVASATVAAPGSGDGEDRSGSRHDPP